MDGNLCDKYLNHSTLLFKALKIITGQSFIWRVGKYISNGKMFLNKTYLMQWNLSGFIPEFRILCIIRQHSFQTPAWRYKLEYKCNI